MNKQFLRNLINPMILMVYRLNGIKVQDSLIFCDQKNKREFIKKTYNKRKDIRIFIETGTCAGDTVEFVKKDFKKIYSIELSDKYANEAKKRFEKDENVFIITGDSAEEIPKLIKEINEPCVFWLDGHYSYGDTAKSKLETPIIEELKPILEMNQNHLILIDDARLFIGKHNYPFVLSLKRFIKKINSKYSIHIERDIITLSQD
jgi:vacuolar-type H+-ATPase subunit F/Vma7